MQMQLHQPPGNPFHTHNGDQWEVVLEGEIVYTVRGQPLRVIKAGESAPTSRAERSIATRTRAASRRAPSTC
jgi:hypothetical protein